LFLADKSELLLAEIESFVNQTEDLLDLVQAMQHAYNKEESLLFLALAVTKEHLPSDLLYEQPFHQLGAKECAILTEGLSDLDQSMRHAYNKEESLLFLALAVTVAVLLLTLAPPTKTLIPKPLLPTEWLSLSLLLL